MQYRHSDVTEGVIKAFYKVYNALGYGFLEKVYENALVYELEKRGFHAQQQVAIRVQYEGLIIGDYVADIIVNNVVVLELKAVDAIAPIHEAQLLNYLRASGIEVGLLLNFGPKPRICRRIFELVRPPQPMLLPSNTNKS
jgi:GxxExxY protein